MIPTAHGNDPLLLPRLLHPLPHLLRLPVLLPRRARLVLNPRLPPLPRNLRRYRTLLHLYRHRHQDPLQQTTSRIRQAVHPRSAAPTNDHRICHPPYWSLLVCVDVRSRHPLGAAGRERCIRWVWYLPGVLAESDLYRGYVFA